MTGWFLAFLWAPPAWARCAVEAIDAHTHLDFGGGVDDVSGIADTREEFLSEAKEACVVGAIAHLPVVEGPQALGLGDFPVVQCAGVGDEIDPGNLEAALQAGAGCIKIYLGYVAHYASDPVYEPVYALAQKYKVPVVFHTGDTSTIDGKIKYADPLPIDEVAVDHREVTFVIAHLGNPWTQTAAEIAYKNPNVYVEASGMFVGTAQDVGRRALRATVVRPLQWAFLYIEDPSKLMFGTDWPIADLESTRWAYEQAIPRKYWQQVFHDNAVAVFHVPAAKE